MTMIRDPRTDRVALILPCRVCRKPVYFGFTAKGRRCPYDVVDGEPTTVSHFTTCERVKDWNAGARE